MMENPTICVSVSNDVNIFAKQRFLNDLTRVNTVIVGAGQAGLAIAPICAIIILTAWCWSVIASRKDGATPAGIVW